METLAMKDGASSKSDVKHGPDSNSGEKNKAGEDLAHIEIITVGNTNNGGKPEDLQLLIPKEHANGRISPNGIEPLVVKNGASSKSDVKHGPNSNSGEKNKAGEDLEHIPVGGKPEDLQILAPVEEHIDSENKPHYVNEGLSQDLGQDLLDSVTSQDAAVNDLPSTSGACNVPDPKNLDERNKGQQVEEPQASELLPDEDHSDRECPICTEIYDANSQKQLLLNCKHSLCNNCIKTLVDEAEDDLIKVRCPLCRLTTPRTEWAVHKMQERMMESEGVIITQEYVAPPEPINRRPRLYGALENRLQERFQNGRLVGFPTCVRNPQRVMNWLDRLQRRSSCLYVFVLMLLALPEASCFIFMFAFMVIILLIVYAR